MTKLEKLQAEIEDEDLDYLETKILPKKLSGLYTDGCIYIDKTLSGIEKTCIIAEELGHYHTSYGDILDQSKIGNIKQERKARGWAHEKLIPLDRLAAALAKNPRSRFELAEDLDITEEFLTEALEQYKERYGPAVRIDEKTILTLDPPPGVLRVVG
ncbi:MAG: ImmA/IrrE family metallo-endopeptidase [Bacillota bacterium]|nr:ImmA/IrrE family metallo-endopeptidase [Bacillota bacterium]